jgi:hypothetical protein
MVDKQQNKYYGFNSEPKVEIIAPYIYIRSA